MNHSFHPLPYSYLPPGIRICTALHQLPGIVSLQDPAIKTMTDLAFTQAHCISPLSTMSQANEKMIYCGVRMLLVSERADEISGLITSTDISGERPVRYLQKHAGRREDILVRDVMTPLSQLDALNMSDVKKSHVGDIVQTLEFHGRQHLLVYEQTSINGNCHLRGIFSSSQIERQLGYKISSLPRALTFAEIEMSLTN
ncbi:MAG: CBS domain-containing protein [Gammaproteobacteria bacterium]|nr:CBS domain-containing protein [Gammaproteobacteria bacterium]